MLIGKNSKYLLKKTRSKAKMYEYNVPENQHIAVESNANELLLIAIAVIGNISAEVLNDNNPHRIVPQAKKTELEFASHFFDAFFNSGLEPNYDYYYLLLGSISYYFCDYIGSSKVMADMISIDDLDEDSNEIEMVLIHLLRNDIVPIEFREDNPYAEYLSQFIDCYDQHFNYFKNVDFQFVPKFRELVYSYGTPRELLLTDSLLAILLTKVERSALNLLPIYSGLTKDNWKSMLHNQQNLKELWPAQIRLGELGIFAGNSAVVQMPTSAGKTTSISIAIRSAFISGKTSLAVVVAPYRALCREISFDISKDFSDDSNIKINELSDILEIDESLDLDELFNFNIKNIVVLTPEKLIYLLRQNRELFNSIGLIIFDEAHILDDASRGAKYELLIATIIGYLGNDTQRLMISAVIPNADQLNNWFTNGEGVVIADNSIKASEKSIAINDWNRDYGDYGYLYFINPENSNEEEFYVPRVISIQALKKLHPLEKVRTFPQVNFETSRVEHNDMAIYLANKLNHNGGVAIFCGTKLTVDSVLDRTLEIEKRGVDISSFITDISGSENIKISNLIKENYGNENVYYNAAIKGVFAHHGGISNSIRISIEYAMKENLIKCIICTSTLAQGVNLPIKYLIISNLYQANERIKVRDFHNLIGRAGRAGLFTEGTIILSEPFVYSKRQSIRDKWRWNSYKTMLDASNSESCISELLFLVRPFKIEVTYGKVVSLDFYILIKNRYDDTGTYEKDLDTLIAEFSKQYPTKENALRGAILHIQNGLDALESYLLSFLADEEDPIHDIASVLENTFGYYLANEAERERLKQLLYMMKDYLLAKTNDVKKCTIYSRTLLGVKQLIQLDRWVKDNMQDLIDCNTSSEVLQMIASKLVEYSGNNTLKSVVTADSISNLAAMWIQGKTYKQILDYAVEKKILIIRRKKISDILLNEIINICDNGFGYSSTLVINAISELLLLNCDDYPHTCNILNELTKQMRYGLPTKKSIVIYEAGFSDRVLSQLIEHILDDISIKSKRQFISAVNRRRTKITDILIDFPSIFIDRLNKI